MKNLFRYAEGYIKVILLHKPIFYYGLHFLRKYLPFFKEPLQYPCFKDMDICIEAYPSSANTFLFGLLINSSPNLKIAHHTHAIASVKRAKRYRIPVVIIIRDPLDAISSRIVRFNRNITVCLIEYIWFYQYVFYNRNSLILFSFDELTTKTKDVLMKIKLETMCDLAIQNDINMLEIKKSIFEKIDNYYTNRGLIKRSATPSTDRNLRKEGIKTRIINPPM